jgi:hypothetical protein
MAEAATRAGVLAAATWEDSAVAWVGSADLAAVLVAVDSEVSREALVALVLGADLAALVSFPAGSVSAV